MLHSPSSPHYTNKTQQHAVTVSVEFVPFWILVLAFFLHVYLWLVNLHKRVDLPPLTVLSKSHCDSKEQALNPRYKSVIRERDFIPHLFPA